MAHHEPPHQGLRCLQIQLFSSLVVKELNEIVIYVKYKFHKILFSEYLVTVEFMDFEFIQGQ